MASIPIMQVLCSFPVVVQVLWSVIWSGLFFRLYTSVFKAYDILGMWRLGRSCGRMQVLRATPPPQIEVISYCSPRLALVPRMSCHRTAAPLLRRVRGLLSLAGLFGLCMKREGRPLGVSMQILESKQADQTVEGSKRNEAGGS